MGFCLLGLGVSVNVIVLAIPFITPRGVTKLSILARIILFVKRVKKVF